MAEPSTADLRPNPGMRSTLLDFAARHPAGITASQVRHFVSGMDRTPTAKIRGWLDWMADRGDLTAHELPAKAARIAMRVYRPKGAGS